MVFLLNAHMCNITIIINKFISETYVIHYILRSVARISAKEVFLFEDLNLFLLHDRSLIYCRNLSLLYLPWWK